MKKIIIFSIIALVFLLSCSTKEKIISPDNNVEHSPLYINEFMASNDNTIADENGEFDDWIEIYNDSDESIDLGGYYLSDDEAEPTKSMIPTGNSEITTIPAKGFLLLWADGQPEQGPLHLNFKLSGSGEYISLTDKNGTSLLDDITFDTQTGDVSYGRNPDGSDNWDFFEHPTPGTSNNGGNEPVGAILVINEFLASNDTTYADEYGEFDDWIELYNAGDQPINIGGLYVTDDLTDLTKYQIPATNPDSTTIQPGEFLLLWADKQPEQGILHLGDIKLSSAGEQIGIIKSDGITIVDSITFGEQTTDISYGRLPDGSDNWDFFEHPTPGRSNNSGNEPVGAILVINEFLASNDTTYADEYGEFDDWIELYNAGDQPINIGGLYVTDDLTDLTKYQIPATNPDSTTIQPGEFLLLWADKQPEQGILHLGDIKLSSAGEQIGIVKSDGTTIVDSITFGEQTTDISYGRLPDGSNNWEFFEHPTPGSSNQ